MSNISGIVVAFIITLMLYLLAKLDMYKEIEGNIIFIVFLFLVFMAVGYFITKFMSEPKKPKKSKIKNVKGGFPDDFPKRI